MAIIYNVKLPLHKKWSLSLSISLVNVTKPTGNCGFGHIYWKKWKTSFFVCSICYTIPSKFGYKFLTFLTKLVLEAKTTHYLNNPRKSPDSWVFDICCRCLNLTYFYSKLYIKKKHHLYQSAIISLTIESVAFRNRHLNGANSISDLKLPCLNFSIFLFA